LSLVSLKFGHELMYSDTYVRDHKVFVDGFAKQMEAVFKSQNGVSPDQLRLINLLCVKYLVSPFARSFFNKPFWFDTLNKYFSYENRRIRINVKGHAEFLKQRCALTVVEILYKSTLFQLQLQLQ
jgi:hypothetical protein